MSVEVRVPRLGESISEAVLVEWLKADGAEVRVDEPIATLETDKAAVEIASPEAGVLRAIKKPGDRVLVNDLIARIDPAPVGAASGPRSGGTSASAPRPGGAKPASSSPAGVRPQSSSPSARATSASPARAPGAPSTGAGTDGAARAPEGSPPRPALAPPADEGVLAPSVRRLVEEHGLDPAAIEPSGRGGRLLKEDVLRHLERQAGGTEAATLAPPRERAPAPTPAPAPETRVPESRDEGGRAGGSASSGGERVVPMSRIRQRIAERLVRAQHTAAILTTFNEIDMTRVLEVRARHKESFEQRHGVKLGFMSFFARAVVLALAEIPELNAEIRGTDVVYRSWVHLGVAVGTERGLIVPVIHDAHRLDFAGIEREIARLAERAREGSLSLEELSGGTFTISNGGVYGSLLSTPILNPPQSGILGMHKIEKRPVAVNDQVVIRPMMYVALSYDHRIVDGEHAVTFLVRVKERVEDPERILLEV